MSVPDAASPNHLIVILRFLAHQMSSVCVATYLSACLISMICDDMSQRMLHVN